MLGGAGRKRAPRRRAQSWEDYRPRWAQRLARGDALRQRGPIGDGPISRPASPLLFPQVCASGLQLAGVLFCAAWRPAWVEVAVPECLAFPSPCRLSCLQMLSSDLPPTPRLLTVPLSSPLGPGIPS